LRHHADAVGQRQRLVVVVGDVQRADAVLAHHLADEVAQLLAQAGVQVRQRLVAQQQARLAHQRPRQRHALLLSARQGMRVAPGQLAQTHLAEHVPRAFARRPAPEPVQRQRHVVQRGEVGPQRIVLEHHAELALLGRQPGAASGVHHSAAQAHRAAVQALQPRHQAQQGGLARAGGPEQTEDFSGLQLQAHMVQGGRCAVALVRGIDVQQGHVQVRFGAPS
jgi:hypothetical protein